MIIRHGTGKDEAAHKSTPEKIVSASGFIGQTGEDAALHKATHDERLGWYAGIAS